MSKPTLILATLVAAVTSYFVLLWPASALWSSEENVGRFQGFSHDSRVLVTMSNSAHIPNPEVYRWDARTGVLLSKVAMQCNVPDRKLNNAMQAVRASSDGLVALVGEGVQPDFGNIELAAGNWYVHDGLTGARRAGPIDGMNFIDYDDAFSPTGRWFAGYRGSPTDGSLKRAGGVDIYDSAIGKRIMDLPQTAPDGMVLFSSEDDSVAVWSDRPDKAVGGTKSVIQILELPTGRERLIFELPHRKWSRMLRWNGRHLWMSERLVDGPGKTPQWRAVVFDLTQDEVGEGIANSWYSDQVNQAGERTVCWHGPHWLAHATVASAGQRAKGFAGWIDRTGARFGIAPPPVKHFTALVRFLDPENGSVRYEMPRPISLSIRVSPDGKLIGGGGSGPIEVWDADPPSRWPLALASGLGTGGAIIALSRLRFRNRIFRSRAGAPVAPSSPAS